eukprot:768563-Hanusia_phi.AAC.7
MFKCKCRRGRTTRWRIVNELGGVRCVQVLQYFIEKEQFIAAKLLSSRIPIGGMVSRQAGGDSESG